MTDPINIIGAIQFTNSGLPVQNARIELWDNAGTYGMLGSVKADPAGKFSFWVVDPIASLLAASTITPKYIVYVNNVQVAERSISGYSGTVTVQVDEPAFDAGIPDTSDLVTTTSITVKGRVTNGKNVPVTDLTIQVYEANLGSGILLTEITTNWEGYYETKVGLRNLGNSATVANRALVVKAIDSSDTEIVSSGYIFNPADVVVADLSTDGTSYTYSSSEYDMMAAAIAAVSGSVNPYASITNDEVDLTSGPYPDMIAYLSNATGKAKETVALTFYAKLYATSFNVIYSGSSLNTKPLYYALCKVHGTRTNPVIRLREQIIRDTIDLGIDSNYIASYSSGQIDAFVTAALSFQLTEQKAEEIAGEEPVTLNDMTLAIFGSGNQTDADHFIALYSSADYSDINDFWTDYESIYGSTLTALAKKGVSLFPVTGFQPEMLEFLMGQLTGSDDFSSLAAWDEATWLGHIQDLCTANSKLCVPKFIKGDITDVGNNEVKETYAQRMKAAVQEYYPLVAIRAALDGSSGGTIIEDSAVRTAVSTFIGNNPGFDLRVSMIHDITSENTDIDLTDITDIEALKSGLAPFQRLLTVTGGQPEALTAMVKDGIDSAQAIANTPEDDFVDNYSAVLGGGPQAQQTYNNATTIAAIANNTTATAFANLNLNNNNYNPAYNPNPAPAGPINYFPPRPIPVYHPVVDPTTDPTLENMFGSLDYCCCCHCMSLYSPSAYLTDMLNFLKSNNVDGYNELIRRRPDLIYIDLTCKNTDTALPYVDLVNELLEKNIIGFTAPSSFQTNGTESDLAGHPEHVYKDANGVYQKYNGFSSVYDSTLANAIYPNGLPFNLALEESRTYLKHLGISRYDAMNLYMPYNPVALTQNTQMPHDQLTLYSACVEYLGLSQTEGDIVTRTHNLSAYPWLFYGLPASYMTQNNAVVDPANPALLLTGSWDIDVLANRIDVLLHYANITYDELLQLLSTISLNSPALVSIAAHDDASPDTCDLAKLKLKATFGNGQITNFLKKMYPFMRLVRSTGLSIYELDTLANSVGITGGYIDNYDLINLSRALSIGKKLDIDPAILIGWLFSFSKFGYYEYGCSDVQSVPSTYDSIFRNPSVFNPTLSIFDLGVGPTFAQNTAIIANVCGLKEEDILLLYDFIILYLSPNVDIPANYAAGYYKLSDVPHRLQRSGLSRLYTYAQLTKKWGITVKELITLFKFLGFENIYAMGDATPVPYLNFTLTVPPPDWDTLVKMDKMIDLIKKSPFSINELNYLLANVDERSVYTAADITIELFYEDLRNELKKFPLIDNTQQVMTPAEQDLVQKLVNTVYQSFSKQFGIPSAWVETMISDGFSQTSPNAPGGFLGDIIDDDFVSTDYDLDPDTIAAQVTPPAVLNDLYYQYRYFHKVSLLANKLKLRTVEFNYLYSNPDIIDYPFSTILNGSPVNTPVLWGSQYLQTERLIKWIQVRDKLGIIDTDFIAFLAKAEDSNLNNTFFTDWQAMLAANSTWGDFLPTLLGTSVGNSPTGLLRVKSPDNFRPRNTNSPELILSIIDVMSWTRRIGLNPDKIQKVLLGNLVLDDSDKILQAAKGKHRDSEWNKIAKPLRDVLRERQRQALVAYTLANPDPINHKVWFKENDLYAYFLIDVATSPCMKTSRIKQAISSVQLYVDRIMLNQEYTLASTPITLNAQLTKQWNTWRKWYRVWEANRKVFLYPENWLEPELRDDKTQFFKEFETQLAQDDITDDHVYDAMEQYLHKVDEIARLEPVGTCNGVDPTTGKDIVHVVSRTYGDPHKYYCRRLVDDLWTPWEYIDIDIKSEHVIPFVWNNRLHLYWLTFKEKQNKVKAFDRRFPIAINDWFFNNQSQLNIDPPVDPDAPTEYGIAPQKQIEISLNWSEYKNGKWQKHKIGKEKMLMKLNPELDKNLKNIFETNSNVRPFYNAITQNRTKSTTEMVQSMFYIYPGIAYDTNFLYLKVFFNHDDISRIGSNPDVTHIHCTHCFRFQDDSAEPEVLSYALDNELNIITPTGTYHANMRFTERPYNGDRPLKLDHYNTFDWEHYLFYSYVNENFVDTLKQIGIDSSANILNNTGPNGIFNVVVKSNFLTNPLENQFLFYDYNNTYFVRQATPKLNKYYIDPNLYNLNLNDPHINYHAAVLTNWKYYFQTFYHPQIHSFVRTFNGKGFDGLLDLNIQVQDDHMNFVNDYQPNLSLVHPWYPTDRVDFDIAGAYSIYNWEIFFHIPLMIAQRLSENQKFSEARKWFHYIFDPTSTVILNNQPPNPASQAEQRQCFWKFMPFYIQAGYNIQTLNDILVLINWGNDAAVAQVKLWEANPFNPYVIARLRMLAFMKSVVMKYVDNLIAWGDMLFEQNTIESINEATQLYILAANILGERPVEVPQRVTTSPKCFHDIENSLDAFSNAAVNMETYMPHNTGPVLNAGGNKAPLKMFYFCLSPNDKLLAYWDTVADRLFKIRNCRNIQGQVQQLPLFQPPIDPALLVRATAAGVDISSVLNDISNVNLPHYRFNYMLQKANEFCNDIKALGSGLLSALEKKDAEELALLRSGLEFTLLDSVKRMKESQLEEANANLEALNKSKEVTQSRYDYYSSRPYLNSREQEHLTSLKKATALQVTQGALQAVSSALSMIPQIHVQATFAVGPSWGGQHIGAAMQAASAVLGIKAMQENYKGNVANIMGGYDRRKDDWTFQTQSAKKELEQIDKQIIAAEIRIAIAEKDLENQEIQIENNRSTDEYMRSKYTNKELYNWMITQISTTYFQAYRLAYEMAKKAGGCYDFELPLAEKRSDEIIQFGYWDSLRKGLLSGEKLQYDLRKLEAAYLDENKRQLELTKHVSLAFLDAEQLQQLKATGTCMITMPEGLFDLDYPTHYNRRIKSVSLSIPCVAGPYTTVPCTLTLNTGSAVRIAASTNAYDINNANWQTIQNVGTSVIATSNAQNDSGMFEFNFRDERYLPFEGAGVISQWNLTLGGITATDGPDTIHLRPFDFDTISDVIMHVKYTAEDDPTQDRSQSVYNTLKDGLLADNAPVDVVLPIAFSLKNEYSNEWFAGFNELSDNAASYHVARPVTISIKHDQFPYFCKEKDINLLAIQLFAVPKDPGDSYSIDITGVTTSPTTLSLTPSDTPTPYHDSASFSGTVQVTKDDSVDITFNIYKDNVTPLDESIFDNFYVLIEYKLD